MSRLAALLFVWDWCDVVQESRLAKGSSFGGCTIPRGFA